jgi:phosphopantothenoylcysteine decarboxylase/phosphopantothenate--cysteine ligase
MINLTGKKIVLGITGSIAAYKSPELVRHLKKAGAVVKVAMTTNATRFVTPLTFETLSGNRVICDMFSQSGTSIDHVSLGQESDLIIIAPATANFLAKIAHGLGDDFLSTLILATTAKILICPAMDKEMFSNSIARRGHVSQWVSRFGAVSRSISYYGRGKATTHRSRFAGIKGSYYCWSNN